MPATSADLQCRLADPLRPDLEDGRVRAEVDPAAEASALVAQAEGLAYYVLTDTRDSTVPSDGYEAAALRASHGQGGGVGIEVGRKRFSGW